MPQFQKFDGKILLDKLFDPYIYWGLLALIKTYVSIKKYVIFCLSLHLVCEPTTRVLHNWEHIVCTLHVKFFIST